MYWPRSNNRPGFRNKNCLPGFRVSFHQQLTSTRQMAACRGRRPTPGSIHSIKTESQIGIIWTIIIGFIAGVIAKFIMPGDNEPSGFILTTILGIVGAVVATYLGQALGWYRPGEGAGFIGAIVGAVIVLLIWGLVMGRRRTGPV